MIRTSEYSVPNYIFPQNILVSTSDKDKLEVLVSCVLSASPGAMFYATGGTGERLKGILGLKAETNYISIEDFTGCPIMGGGLVQTLHPKIHAGLLAERGNPHHEEFLYEEMAMFGMGPGVYFDIFVGNLYPFNDVVNWHSVTVLSDPSMYGGLSNILAANSGCIPAADRFRFAVFAMGAIAKFHADIYQHFYAIDFGRDVVPTIKAWPHVIY